ncbi:MAG TPA: MBL fold metallo-hydrolase [Gammaproteobacteria bacterium]|nr:MBL fold metallo-hydrolase [Gammaproteobacteria bacterium]
MGFCLGFGFAQTAVSQESNASPPAHSPASPPARDPASLSAEESAAVAAHVDKARSLAGTDVTAPFDFFCVPGHARPNDFSAPPLTPTKLFDNLYVLGNSEAVVHAITTSEGIILIDSGFANQVESVLIPGLEALGLDPADVRLILLGHGHSDHFGGAAYFQTKYGTKVGTTAADWDMMAQAAARGRPGEPPPPSRDRVLREGEPIVLGDTSITPVEVPGHTPGSLAFIFPVFDNGTRHVAGLFGGTVLAAAYTPMSGLHQYVDSIAHYLEIAERMGVDVEIQNHPIFDDTPQRLAALAARRPGEPNPFVMGTDRYQRFWRIVSECMQADIIRKGGA